MGRIIRGEMASSPEAPGEETRARAEAASMLRRAREESIAIREEAREAGQREGREALAAEQEALEAARSRLLGEVEDEVIRIALEVARTVIGAAAGDGGAAVEVARRALARVRGAGPVRLRAHPDDLPALRAAASSGLHAGAGSRAAIDLHPDAAVGRGGVLLETPAGTIDARVETQLAAVAAALQEGA